MFLAAKAREYEADASSCTLYACKVVKKRSLLRRHKKKCSTSAENRSNAPQGKYGYASGDIAREIAIIKSWIQENIVKVIEVLDNPDENRLYVIMDYLPGGSLFPDWDGDGTLDNPLEERDAVILFREIVMAVLYIHNQGVVHFDIKPSNILLAGKSVRKGVKLADFGVAAISLRIGPILLRARIKLWRMPVPAQQVVKNLTGTFCSAAHLYFSPLNFMRHF